MLPPELSSPYTFSSDSDDAYKSRRFPDSYSLPSRRAEFVPEHRERDVTKGNVLER
jgi:hypothetical protein